jgi:mannose-6-phosphate isomerase-like protein (cupin superfamily)
MDAVNFFQEADKLREAGSAGTNLLVQADCFSVDVRIFDAKRRQRLHTCSQDEFFCVLKGEVVIKAGTDSTRLKEGEGIVVKAGVKHITLPGEGASWLLVAKQPHKHHYYEESEP